MLLISLFTMVFGDFKLWMELVMFPSLNLTQKIVSSI